MSGFVGSRAKKRQRNIFFILTFIIFFAILILILPIFNNSNNQVIPNDNIMPDPSEDLTSLTSKTEELELSLFQKDQKIKLINDVRKQVGKEKVICGPTSGVESSVVAKLLSKGKGKKY